MAISPSSSASSVDTLGSSKSSGSTTSLSDNDNQGNSLWVGPSRLATIRTAKIQPFESLLKPTFKDGTAFRKRPHDKPVPLRYLGFGDDERAYPPHKGPERAVLQYNPNHYPDWKKYLENIEVKFDSRRDVLLDVGGFGENIYTENASHTPAMDESTVCIGDLIAFQGVDGTEHAHIRANGPRLPCYKLNHRFGIPNMSQRTQDKGWTGWLYHVEKEGDVEVGDQMVLLERPFPEWTISRIQYYCFKEPKNMEMIKEAVDTLGNYLLFEIRDMFVDRLTKGMEDPTLRLQGDSEISKLAKFRLVRKTRQTDRVSEFVFERVDKLPEDSKNFAVAKSGSHVRLRLKVDGRKLDRPYSVISGNSNKFTLGIALADNSRGGSEYLHQSLEENEVLKASEEFANTFALETEHVNNHVFLAGGIGITAFLDHIRFCLATKQSFHLHYMIRNKSDYAFQKLIEEMFTKAENPDTAKLTVYISADGLRCNLPDLLTSVAPQDQTHIYVCGRERMTEHVTTTAHKLDIPPSRIHVEQFGTDASGDPFTVETTTSHKKIDVGNRQSLLDALRDVGLEVASSCEAGNCGTCRVKVKCGRVLHKGNGLMEDEQAGYGGCEEGEMLSCVSRGVGTIAIEL